MASEAAEWHREGMSTTTRDATTDDSSFLAWVQLAAGRSHLERGFWDLVFDGNEEQILSRVRAVVAAAPQSFCHWSRFRIIEVDGVPAAALSGYEPREVSDDLLAQALIEAAAAGEWGPEVLTEFGQRVVPFVECAEAPPDDHWIVEWVATRPEYRGRGLVRTLLLEMLERGREKGFGKAQISILIGNVAAERAYSSVGFRTFDEKTSPSFEAALGTPGLRRMRMDL